MAEFILVHGTFAKHAPWTLEGSALRTSIIDVIGQIGMACQFTPLPWGGRNRGTDRLAAAASIASHVTTAIAKNNDEKIFLIGHSHGGSAIAYFIKNYPQLAVHVTGVAFLSTPFVATRLRPQWRLFLRSLLVSAAVFLVILAFGGATVFGMYSLNMLYNMEIHLSAWIIPAGVMLGLFLHILAGEKLRNDWSTTSNVSFQ